MSDTMQGTTIISGPTSPPSTTSLKSPDTSTACDSVNLEALKQRKNELEKLLLEKTNLLQQICREEAKMLSCYTVSRRDKVGVDCSDGRAATLSSPRRQVDTTFKLPENLLDNNNKDAITELLLSRQIQQQISEASLKLSNDLSQAKSIRRVHRQNYETAQMKLFDVNQSLAKVENAPFDTMVGNALIDNSNNLIGNCMTNESIGDFLDNVNNNHNNNGDGGNLKNAISKRNADFSVHNKTNFNNSNVSDGSNIDSNGAYIQKFINSANDGKGSTSSLNAKYASNISLNNDIVSQMRNSTIPTVTLNRVEMQPRHNPETNTKFGDPSRDVSQETFELNYKQMHSFLHKPEEHLPDQYIPNEMLIAGAVNAAATIAKLNSNKLSPKYGRLVKPLTVDTNVSGSTHMPIRRSARRRSLQNLQHQAHSPHLNDGHSVRRRAMPSASDDGDYARDGDYDDIASQYATLLALTNELNDQDTLKTPLMGQRNPKTDQLDIKSRYTTTIKYIEKSAPCVAKEVETLKEQGLGGHWIDLGNNDRVWCPSENQYSSLDRNCPKARQKKTLHMYQPTKSTSLGNFDFLDKSQEALHTSPTTSHAIEPRTSKDKPWLETSLDGPVIRQKSASPLILHPISPPIDYRDKHRLSSHSVHSPEQKYAVISRSVSPNVLPQQSSGLNKILSTSATALDSNGEISQLEVPRQLFSPPYYHPKSRTQSQNWSIESPPLHSNDSSFTSDGIQLRRTASNVSSGNQSVRSSVTMTGSGSTGAETVSDIHIESPQNVTVVQAAKFQPYKEVTKPFEMSDFYKYSTKFRQRHSNAPSPTPNQLTLPPKNLKPTK